MPFLPRGLVGHGEHDRDVGVRAGGDELLDAVQHVAVAAALGARRDRARHPIPSAARSGRSSRALAARERLQVRSFCASVPNALIGPQTTRVLHADDRRRRAVAGGDLLERDGERHVVEPGAAPLSGTTMPSAPSSPSARSASRGKRVLAIPRAGVRRELVAARTRAACRGSGAARRSAACAVARRSAIVEREPRGECRRTRRRAPRFDQRSTRARGEPAPRPVAASDAQRESPATTMTSCVAPSTSDCSSTLPRAGSTNCGNSASWNSATFGLSMRRQQARAEQPAGAPAACARANSRSCRSRAPGVASRATAR